MDWPQPRKPLQGKQYDYKELYEMDETSRRLYERGVRDWAKVKSKPASAGLEYRWEAEQALEHFYYELEDSNQPIRRSELIDALVVMGIAANFEEGKAITERLVSPEASQKPATPATGGVQSKAASAEENNPFVTLEEFLSIMRLPPRVLHPLVDMKRKGLKLKADGTTRDVRRRSPAMTQAAKAWESKSPLVLALPTELASVRRKRIMAVLMNEMKDDWKARQRTVAGFHASFRSRGRMPSENKDVTSTPPVEASTGFHPPKVHRRTSVKEYIEQSSQVRMLLSKGADDAKNLTADGASGAAKPDPAETSTGDKKEETDIIADLRQAMIEFPKSKKAPPQGAPQTHASGREEESDWSDSDEEEAPLPRLRIVAHSEMFHATLSSFSLPRGSISSSLDEEPEGPELYSPIRECSAGCVRPSSPNSSRGWASRPNTAPSLSPIARTSAGRPFTSPGISPVGRGNTTRASARGSVSNFGRGSANRAGPSSSPSSMGRRGAGRPLTSPNHGPGRMGGAPRGLRREATAPHGGKRRARGGAGRRDETMPAISPPPPIRKKMFTPACSLSGRQQKREHRRLLRTQSAKLGQKGKASFGVTVRASGERPRIAFVS
uniref:Uncharacterized protein n=1 Tax=Phaeomonas parva TaxID=124430 RepID=A0A7S1UFX2_9STRA|mmetsp:Transcript_46312/g.144876  ORF Transcript_46312/g.144876 Transcript_46312/m.144876 type:complete len:609 (+) Transcript_46312:122-1948(+)